MGQVPALERPFGEVVKAWREHRGMSVTDLAERSGLSQGHISEIERGKIDLPRKPARERLAQALQIDVQVLYTRRLPSDVEEQHSGETTGREDFIFPSPVRTQHRDEEELLRRISVRIDELRTLVDVLIRERDHNHGRS